MSATDSNINYSKYKRNIVGIMLATILLAIALLIFGVMTLSTGIVIALVAATLIGVELMVNKAITFNTDDVAPEVNLIRKLTYARWGCYFLALIVSITTAGGFINPVVNTLTTVLGVSNIVAYIITFFIFTSALFAWFGLYAVGNGNMVAFVRDLIDTNQSNSNTQTSDSDQNNSKKNNLDKAGDVLGYANAIIANSTGLVLGGISFYQLVNFLSKGSIVAGVGLKVAIVVVCAVAGIISASALTRNSFKDVLKLFYDFYNSEDKSANFEFSPLKITLAVVTGFSIAAFNYQAAFGFLPSFIKFCGLNLSGSAIGVISIILGVIAFTLTALLASCLFIKFVGGIKSKESTDKESTDNDNLFGLIKERANKFGNITGDWYFSNIVRFLFAGLGAAAGGVMVYAAFTSQVAIIASIALVISSIVSCIYLIKYKINDNSDSKYEKYIMVLLGLTSILSTYIAFAEPAWAIQGGFALNINYLIFTLVALYVFFKLYDGGYQNFATWAVCNYYELTSDNKEDFYQACDFVKNKKHGSSQESLQKIKLLEDYPSSLVVPKIIVSK